MRCCGRRSPTSARWSRRRSTSRCGSSRAGPTPAPARSPRACRGRSQSQGADKLPKFAFNVELQSGGQHRQRRARPTTGAKAFITLQGTPYEVSDLVLRQFVAGYEQSLKSRAERARAGWSSARSASTSAAGCKNPRNEGEAQVGDAETIKITGAADVDQVIADLDKITERAANLPGAGGRVPQQLTPAAEAARDGRHQGAQRHASTRAPTTRSCAASPSPPTSRTPSPRSTRRCCWTSRSRRSAQEQ